MPEDIKIDLEILKREYSQLNVLIARLDTTIEKLSEVSSGINRMLAVHENRLEQQEETTRIIFDLLEQRRKEVIESMEKLKREIEQEATKSHAPILEKLDKVMKSTESFERWRYLVIGGAMVLGFLAARLPILQNIFG